MKSSVAEIDALIGARLRRRRLELGLSQAALAEHLGVTFQQVQKYEWGRNRIAASTLVQCATLLRCSPNWLTGFEEASEARALCDSQAIEVATAFQCLRNHGLRAGILSVVRSAVELEGDSGGEGEVRAGRL